MKQKLCIMNDKVRKNTRLVAICNPLNHIASQNSNQEMACFNDNY